jgi:uncharacterized protein
MEIESVRKVARSYFEGVDPSHDWYHVKRVLGLALEMAEREQARDEVVQPAVLLHDLGRKKEDEGEIDDHAEWSAREAQTILNNHGYSGGLIEDVQHCLRAHRYSNDIEPETLEAMILADADNLDALGAIGIARTFAYSGENDRILINSDFSSDQEESPQGETGANHLRTKILSLKERMYTDSGREMAQERHEFVKTYLNQLEQELE